MKQSIKKIFVHISLILLLTSFIAGIAFLLMFEQNNSYKKIDNLNKQKEIVATLTRLKKDDIELALIQFNGKSAQLHNEIGKLNNIYKLDLTGRYLLQNTDEYLADLNKLSELTTEFNQRAQEYYTPSNENMTQKEQNLQDAFDAINNHINNIIFKNISYDKQKFYIYEKLALGIFIILFIIALWYRKKLNAIYQDILYLYAPHKTNYTIYTEEIDAILLRIHRKPLNSDNPEMLDAVTGIKNYKGLLNAYTQKKGMKESNFTSVTVLEIDNFSKTNRTLPQEVTQSILKKIAFTISLHEQATDVIGRTDYNQFTIILSRASKEEAFKEIEVIRRSIEETKFKIPGQGFVNITVSGGFVIKPNNQLLEDALKKANEVLKYAKSTGRNKIAQIKDLAESNL